jgi:hypothetical protein
MLLQHLAMSVASCSVSMSAAAPALQLVLTEAITLLCMRQATDVH